MATMNVTGSLEKVTIGSGCGHSTNNEESVDLSGPRVDPTGTRREIIDLGAQLQNSIGQSDFYSSCLLRERLVPSTLFRKRIQRAGLESAVRCRQSHLFKLTNCPW